MHTCASAPHRILSTALLTFGKISRVRGDEGNAWLSIAKLLRDCRHDDMIEELHGQNTASWTSRLGADLTEALHASTLYLNGDALAAANQWAAAVQVAGASRYTRVRVPLLRYLQGRGELGAQRWAAAAASFDAAITARAQLLGGPTRIPSGWTSEAKVPSKAAFTSAELPFNATA